MPLEKGDRGRNRGSLKDRGQPPPPTSTHPHRTPHTRRQPHHPIRTPTARADIARPKDSGSEARDGGGDGGRGSARRPSPRDPATCPPGARHQNDTARWKGGGQGAEGGRSPTGGDEQGDQVGGGRVCGERHSSRLSGRADVGISPALAIWIWWETRVGEKDV